MLAATITHGVDTVVQCDADSSRGWKFRCKLPWAAARARYGHVYMHAHMQLEELNMRMQLPMCAYVGCALVVSKRASRCRGPRQRHMRVGWVGARHHAI